MNIAVVAANGRSGKAFVDAALAAGHAVRAGVYKTNTLVPHPQLTIIECDATKEADLMELIKGADAVTSFIGHVKGSPAHVQTDAIRTLAMAMYRQNLKRLVTLTGTGVRFAGDKVSLVDRFLNASIQIIDPARIQDGKDHVAFLKESTLDWTIIRVLKLQNTKPKPFLLKEHGPTKWYVSREDVAKATLQVLEENSFIHQAPIISSVK